MYSRALKIVLGLLFTAAFAFANEGGGEAPAEGEGGEAKSEKKALIRSAEDAFQVVQSRVQALEAKIHSAQEEIKGLISEKQHAKDAGRVNEIIRQMQAIHRTLVENLKEYDQQRALMKYRYPEKAAVENREYERIELRSIEEMEAELSLSASLNKTIRKVRSQYGRGEATRVPAQADSETPITKKKTTPGLIDAVILKK